MEDALTAQREILDFLRTSDIWKLSLSEAGEFLCTRRAFELELRYQKLLITFRLPVNPSYRQADQTEKIVTRRVIGYEICEGKFLRLTLGRFSSSETFGAIISSQRVKASLPKLRERRDAYRKLLKSLISEHFTGVKFIKKSLGSLQNASRLFTKFFVSLPGKEAVAVGVDREESQSEMNKILSVGLIWYSHLKARHKRLRELYLFLPEAKANTVLNRAAWINKRTPQVRVFEVTDNHTVTRLKLPAEGTPPSCAWPVRGPYKTSPLLLKVIGLEPNLIRRYPRLNGYDSLRIHGLEFAKVYGKSREAIAFGVGKHKENLTKDNWPELKKLVAEIAARRRFDTPDKQHPFYRLQQERWLESLLLDDIKKLGLELDETCVYSQVPVYLGEDRGVADILTVDRDGRLIVIEVKADLDIDLPFQGLDYWSSVHWYNRHHVFQKHGYFQGVKLSKDYPLLYLVAPLFRFHKSFDVITGFIRPEVEMVKIGVNWDWRRELKVLRKEPTQTRKTNR